MTIAALNSKCEETAPRKTVENTVKHCNGAVGSVLVNHCWGSDSSVVVTTVDGGQHQFAVDSVSENTTLT